MNQSCSPPSVEDRLRLLARAFTRPVLHALASDVAVDSALASWLQYGIASRRENAGTLAELLDSAWHELCADYRCEYVYKNSLASKLVFHRHRPHTAAFLSELSVAKSIADVVVVNGTTTAYEVKTKYDSPRRIVTQSADYLKVFDHVYVVAHGSLLDKVETVLSPQVGLIELDDAGVLRTFRTAKTNAANVNPSAVFRLFRKQEYLGALQDAFGELPDLPNGLMTAECAKRFARLDPLTAHAYLVRALKARTTDKATASFLGALPVSLRALGYATPLSAKQRQALLCRLSTSASIALA